MLNTQDTFFFIPPVSHWLAELVGGDWNKDAGEVLDSACTTAVTICVVYPDTHCVTNDDVKYFFRPVFYCRIEHQTVLLNNGRYVYTSSCITVSRTNRKSSSCLPSMKMLRKSDCWEGRSWFHRESAFDKHIATSRSVIIIYLLVFPSNSNLPLSCRHVVWSDVNLTLTSEYDTRVLQLHSRHTHCNNACDIFVCAFSRRHRRNTSHRRRQPLYACPCTERIPFNVRSLFQFGCFW